jgi:nicotinamide-nucleotide amidase
LPDRQQIFERGFVTYSNQAKMDLLGVSERALSQFGAVSSETAEEMVRGALNNSRADLAIAVTGNCWPFWGLLG